MSSDYYYVVSDYFGTGEGVTKALLITRALPRGDELDENYKPKYTPETVALRQFDRTFNSFIARGAEVIGKEEFVSRFESLIPEQVRRVINNEVNTPGNFSWFTELHINYS